MLLKVLFVCLPLVLFGIDVLVLLLRRVWRWSGKDNYSGIHLAIEKAGLIKNGDVSDFACLQILWFVMSAVVLTFPAVTGVVVLIALILTAAAFALRGIRTLFKAVKTLGKHAHKHDGDKVAMVEVDGEFFTKAELAKIKEMRR